MDSQITRKTGELEVVMKEKPKLEEKLNTLEAQLLHQQRINKDESARINEATQAQQHKLESELERLTGSNTKLHAEITAVQQEFKKNVLAEQKKLNKEMDSTMDVGNRLMEKIEQQRKRLSNAEMQVSDTGKEESQRVKIVQGQLREKQAEASKEQSEKAAAKVQAEKERAEKQGLRDAKKEKLDKNLAKRTQVEVNHAIKQAAVRQQQRLQSLRAANEQLKDEISVTEKDAELKQQAISYKLVQDKAQAARDGQKAIEDYKQRQALKQSDQLANVVTKAENQLTAHHTDTKALKLQLQQLKQGAGHNR